ncbi:DUF3040 domain-containing protein [Pseudonocardia acidicola]|uniref:DUF3040 domain-containing protein n=1 Tax=Pseudonocardia acidicola TaxID=2724939 RepID=A0ABX1SJ04_9PSEU|nr:DUF3040 domain-containing protein [Pseudonocardia acidicola]
MLSDRERGVLVRIEQDLSMNDPDLVRLFQTLSHARTPRRPVTMRAAGVVPCALLIIGLVLLLLGGASTMIPIVGIGIVLTLLALALAYSSGAERRPGPA